MGNPSAPPPPGADLPSSRTEDLLDRVRGSATVANAAWPELLARSESRLRTLLHFRAAGRVRSNLDPDDLLQEVWIEATQKIHDFEYRGPGSLQRWLAAILRFKLLHASRQAGRRPLPEAALSPPAGEERSGLFDALSRSQPGVSFDARRRETEQRVRVVLEDLPEELREAVLLKVYEGLTGREASERLGISESALSKRFHKALERVGRQLREETP